MCKYRLILLTATMCATIACGSSPTAPTPVATIPPVVTTSTQPPVVTPPTPAPNPLLSDPRFDRTFFKQFVHDGLERPSANIPLNRQSAPPSFYLWTVDDAGNAIDPLTLDQTANAVLSTARTLAGTIGGLERGTSPTPKPNLIQIRWSTSSKGDICGESFVGGTSITLYPRSIDCRCAGGPAVALTVIKHELGHALGFWHTDGRTDLMYAFYNSCDQEPSAREVFHASVAYSLPNGTRDP